MVTKLHFRFESRLAKLLGRQSVTNERDAIFELVKNGYDADATKVDVIFSNLMDGTGKIIVRDNGGGMTKHDIENKFMVVATSSKIRETTTKGGRSVVGEKGIGRFAMERLGTKTTIISYPQNESTAYKLTIDWDRYEVEGTTFDEIGNEFETFQKEDAKKHGIEIVSENLRDKWDDEKIRGLSKKLGLLLIPEGFKQKLPFEITLTAPEFGLTETTVKSNLLDKAPYKLVAKLQDNRIHLQIWEKGKKIVSVEKGNHIIESASMRCGPAIYRMWGFPFDKPGENQWTKYYGIRHLDALRDFLNENHGIKIYRDGFRVMPYGERGIDWTERGAAARRRSGVLPIHNMTGWVEITATDNPELITTTTRHRLIEDEKFEDLRNFLIESDYVLDKHMYEQRVAKRQEIKKNVPNELEQVAKKINNLEILDEIKKPLIRNLKDCSVYLKELEEEHERDQERLMYKVEAYRNLASLGLTTAAIAHEINIHLGNILSISERLKRHLETGHLSNSDLLKISIELTSSTQYVHDYMGFIRHFSSTLKSDEPAFRKKLVMNLKQELETSFKWFEHYFKRYNIKPQVDLPDDLEVLMFRSDLQSIFTNLMSNSIKAIQRERSSLDEITSAKKSNKIRISLATNPRITSLQIIYSNDGPPINPKIADKIFETFVSDYNELDKTSMGSGLGLSLVKEILESYGGEIDITKSEFNPGVSFLITMPWEGIKKT